MEIYGRVYKLVCSDTGDCYIGSTRNSLQFRLQYHINDVAVGHTSCVSKDIIKRNNFRIELLEEGYYESKEALLWRERWWMENVKCINKFRPIITQQERRECDNQSARKIRGNKFRYYVIVVANTSRIKKRPRKTKRTQTVSYTHLTLPTIYSV